MRETRQNMTEIRDGGDCVLRTIRRVLGEVKKTDNHLLIISWIGNLLTYISGYTVFAYINKSKENIIVHIANILHSISSWYCLFLPYPAVPGFGKKYPDICHQVLSSLQWNFLFKLQHLWLSMTHVGTLPWRTF